MAENGNSKDSEEILYLGMAILGLIGLKQLWTLQIRPWIESTWGDLQAGQLADLPVVGPIDQADLIGMGVLVIPLLVVVTVLVSWAKRRKRAKPAKALADGRES